MLQAIQEEKSKEGSTSINTPSSDPGIALLPPPVIIQRQPKKAKKENKAYYDKDGNLIREKKIKIDEFGNPVKKDKKKKSKKKSPDMKNKHEPTVEKYDNKAYGKDSHGRTFEKPHDHATFTDIENEEDNKNNNDGDNTKIFEDRKGSQEYSPFLLPREESISTLGNVSAAEIVRQGFYRAAQQQLHQQQLQQQKLEQEQQRQKQSAQKQQQLAPPVQNAITQHQQHLQYGGALNNYQDNVRTSGYGSSLDKFQIFAQDFEGQRPREGSAGSMDKLRMFADSFEVTADQFSQFRPAGYAKPPGYKSGSYGAQQGYIERQPPQSGGHAKAPPAAYAPTPASSATDAEIQAKAETHALVVQYLISSGMDVVIAEHMACQFEEAQQQGMDNNAQGPSAPSSKKSHDVNKFAMFSEGDKASVPDAFVRALAQGSVMAGREENEQVHLGAASLSPPVTRTAPLYSAADRMPVAPLTPDGDDPEDARTRALLIQYLISVGTDPVIAEQIATQFNEQQCASRNDEKKREIQSLRRKHLDAMNGGHNPRPGARLSAAAVPGRGPVSQSMPAGGGRPPHWSRAERPGAVEMQGRAFGAPRRVPDTQRQSDQYDDEIEQLDIEADLVYGGYIEAVPVPEKDSCIRGGHDVVYAESTTFGIKHILNERSVRRFLYLVCLLIVGIFVGATVVAVRASRSSGGPHSTSFLSATASPTGTPTSAPSFVNDDIEQAAGAISGFGSVLAIESPQRRAVGWLSSTDKFDTQGLGLLFSQRYILTVFYFATKGEQWLEQDKWLSPTLHVCDWSVSIVCGADATQRRVVTGLDLTRNGLSGYIPNEVGLIDGLSLLRLARNSIKGTIPESISKLTGLSLLDLSVNELSGTVPSGIGNLENLVSLELYENALTGQIPSSAYDLDLLEKVDLSKNELTGPLSQDVSKLRSLATLNLRNNELNGQLPVFTGLTKLDFILLDNNQFSGSLPNLAKDVIGRLDLSLANNRISGSVPGLQEVNVTEFEGVEVTIQRIDFSYNQLTGTIDPLIALVPTFRYIDLSGNSFTGPVPAQASTVGGWTALEHFGVAGNRFTGTFPLGFTGSLTFLDLSGNRLTGGIPLELYTNFPKLEYLVLGHNPLGGRLSGLLGQLNALRAVQINNCSLTGLLPENIRALTNLDLLDFQGNAIVGTIPSSFGALGILRELELQNNKLTGTLPIELLSLEQLNVLNVSNNSLTGTLPSTLIYLSKLKEFDVSGNFFTGDVPEGVCDNVNITRAMVGCNLACSCCVGADICGDRKSLLLRSGK